MNVGSRRGPLGKCIWPSLRKAALFSPRIRLLSAERVFFGLLMLSRIIKKQGRIRKCTKSIKIMISYPNLF